MRRALSVSAWIVGALLLLVITLGGIVLVAGGTDIGRAQIERLTARLSEGRVRMSGLGGSFPTAINCARLQLSDERGCTRGRRSLSHVGTPSGREAHHVAVAVWEEKTMVREIELVRPRSPVRMESEERVQLVFQRGEDKKIDVHASVFTGSPALAAARRGSSKPHGPSGR